MTTDQEVDKLSEAETETGTSQVKESTPSKDKAQSKEKEKSQSKIASYISQARLKLNPGLNYVLDGFPPVIAVIALVVAVLAMNENRSLRSQLSIAVAKIESLSTNKGFASREDLNKVKASVEGIEKSRVSIEELEKIKAVMAQEKVTNDAELNKQSERNEKIIRGVSKLQVKMKIAPTLEAQMREPAPAKAPIPASAPVKQIILSKPEVSADTKLSPVKPATKAEVPTAKAPVTLVTEDVKKAREAQVKSIKEQIDEFNKK